MKASVFSLVLLALGLGSAPAALATTVVSGHITHPSGNEFAIIYERGPISGGPRGRAEGKLDAKGNFRLELPKVTAPTLMTFEYGDESTAFYLSPGDNLTLTLDAAQFDESIKYSGPGSAASNYLAQSYLKFEDDPTTAPYAKAKTSTPAAFRQLLDEQRRQQLVFLSTYATAHPLTPDFRAYARQTIAFDWAALLLAYPDIRKRETPDDVPTLPAGYDDFLASVRPMQDSAMQARNVAYMGFMGEYVYVKLMTPGQPLTDGKLLAAVRQQFGDAPSRDLAAAKYVYQVMQQQGGAAAAPLKEAFRQANRDSTLAQSIRDLYARQPEMDKRRAEMAAQKKLAQEALAAGKEAPNFTVRDANGKTVSLADYKGKVVYLDFWASWCGPCMAEVPAGVALKKQFEGKEVVFLYVSIDDKEENWRKALNTKPLQSANSVHTLDKGWAAPAPVAYHVQGIPAHFLVGRDGRFAVDEAPSPSQGAKMAKLLTEALAKK